MTNELAGLRGGWCARCIARHPPISIYYSFTAFSNDTVIVGADSPSYDTYHRLRFQIVDTNDSVLAELVTPYYAERDQTDPCTIPADGTYLCSG